MKALALLLAMTSATSAQIGVPVPSIDAPLPVTGSFCAAIQDCCKQPTFRQSTDPRAGACPLLDEIARQDKIIGELQAKLGAKR